MAYFSGADESLAKYLPGRVPMLVLHAYSTDYSTSVAVVRLADVAALKGRAQSRVSEKAQFATFWYALRLLKHRRFSLPSLSPTRAKSRQKSWRPCSKTV